MGGAVGDDDSLDVGAAAGAGGVVFLVDFEELPEAAHVAVGVAEIAESRAAISNCALYDSADGGA